MTESRTEESHYYRLGSFEGPLDLLLFLIKKNEVNIYDIPISEITEQYLEYLDLATKVDLENITEFYVMAATLLYIKSRMLLPVELNLSEEMEDPRSELVEQLIEYQRYKKLGDLMADRESHWFLERKQNQSILPFEQDDGSWEEVAVWDLLKLFSSLVSAISMEQVIDLREEVTVNEKTALIYEFLEDRGEFDFAEIIDDEKSITEIVCAFLAILELVRQKQIRIVQNKLFGDILIRRRQWG